MRGFEMTAEKPVNSEQSTVNSERGGSQDCHSETKRWRSEESGLGTVNSKSSIVNREIQILLCQWADQDDKQSQRRERSTVNGKIKETGGWRQENLKGVNGERGGLKIIPEAL
jgi:hypothetical protein